MRPCSSTVSASATDPPPPKADIAVDPIDGTTSTAALGRGGALAVIAVSEEGYHVRPRSLCLHGEAGRRAYRWPSGAIRHHSSDRGQPQSGGRRLKGTSVRDVTAVILDRPSPRGRSSPTVRAERRPHPAHHRRRCGRGHRLRRGRTLGVDPLLIGIGGHSRRSPSRPPLSSPMGGEMQGRLWPRDDEERKAVHRGRVTTSTPCSPPTTSSEATIASSQPRGSPTANCWDGVRYDQFGASTQSLVMLEVRHGTPGRRPAPATQAQRVQRHSIQLSGAARSPRRGEATDWPAQPVSG